MTKAPEVSSNISHITGSQLQPLTHEDKTEKDSGASNGSAGDIISYIPASNSGLPQQQRRRRRPGRPCQHWTKRVSYQRRFCPRRLRRIEVENLFEADAFASRIGLRLTTFVSVRWALTREEEAQINLRWSALLNALRLWMQRRGINPAYIYSHENPPRAEPAFNTHMLINWPSKDGEQLRAWLLRYLEAMDPTAVDVQPRSMWGRSSRDRVAYMVKGTDKATAMKYHLITAKGWDYAQGNVHFQRCGTSRNIGRNARRAGFRDQYAHAREESDGVGGAA